MQNFYALIIGVGGKDIPETVKDAKEIYNVLTDSSRGAYDPSNIYLLTEDKSTKSEVMKALDEIAEKSDGSSTVLIYYSGHGQRFYNSETKEYDYYLVTSGSDIGNKEETMLNGDSFSKKISLIRSSRLLVLLDCCHADGIGTLKTKGINTAYSSNRALQEKLESGNGRVFISSCDDDETSVILPGAENSLFTQVAIEIFRGMFSKNREYVSVLDLIYTILQEVPERINKYKHEQMPILTAADGLDHKYYICRNDERASLSDSVINPVIINQNQSSVGTGSMSVNTFDPVVLSGLLNQNDGNTTKTHSLDALSSKSSALTEVLTEADQTMKLDFISNYKNKINQ